MSLPNSEPSQYQLGYLGLDEHGAILSSGGDLENDEVKAEIFYRMVTMQQRMEPFLDEGCTRLSVNYNRHSYVICLSNKKILIVKKETDLRADDEMVDTQVPLTNSINA